MKSILLAVIALVLCLPTAEFGLKEKDSRGRAKVISGTFKVLVVGK